MKSQISDFKCRTPVLVRQNGHALGVAAVLLAMWYAGASQSNGAAYLLCFVLASVVLVSALHAWANLRGVALAADAIRPVFAGEERLIRLHARSERQRAHFGIEVRARKVARVAALGTVPAEGSVTAELAVPAKQRGCFPTLRIQLVSRFPLGFFTAQLGVTLAQPHFVYPEPVGVRPLPPSLAVSPEARDGHRVEGDDFGGVRAWRPGESQRNIDWKAAARGQPLLVKQWFGDADDTLLLDWETLAGLDTEARLSQLARWVLLAEHAGASYGLRLPGIDLAADRGEAHYHACLRALAEHPAV